MRVRWAVWVVVWVMGAVPAWGQVRRVSLEPPARDFGYLAGDVFAARAVIEVAAGTVLDARTLPSVGPVGPGVDVRGVAVSAAGGRVVVSVTYQGFWTPEQVMREEVPGYRVEFVAGGARVGAVVPGFGVLVSPFRHDLQPMIDAGVLKGDHPVEALELGEVWWRLLGGAGVAVVGAAVLAAGRLGGGRRPFAAAARKVGQGGEADLRALHAAFDATAGRRVFAEDLDGFLVAHPRFGALRGEIEGFFGASRAVFFGGGEAAVALRGLSRALARAERLG